ncbi:40S ribosomal protein S18 [Dichanthelium oligosanthes]|uniref:40S ribosomal protein S18 n=1 Tax=Dichanthelium oligosanthes TaxID=888268 RepID=A0A1E5VEW0_9POAL|nr:40S ribosomal protein S18 [Dichanthelium oligosanthes]
MNKRAGELTPEELEWLMMVVANPTQFKVSDWFLNRNKDYKDGRFSQDVSNALGMKLRDDLKRLMKIRADRTSAISNRCGRIYPCDHDSDQQTEWPT